MDVALFFNEDHLKNELELNPLLEEVSTKI